MNDEAAGCYGCVNETYVPREFTGPLDDLMEFWYSIDGLSQGLLVSGIVLVSIFVVAPQLIKRRRRR